MTQTPDPRNNVDLDLTAVSAAGAPAQLPHAVDADGHRVPTDAAGTTVPAAAQPDAAVSRPDDAAAAAVLAQLPHDDWTKAEAPGVNLPGRGRGTSRAVVATLLLMLFAPLILVLLRTLAGPLSGS